MKPLVVLDLGEIVEDDTYRLLATFTPTAEAIAEWENWVSIINAACACDEDED